MPETAEKVEYIVLNPRNFPKGTPLVSIERKHYQEGDTVLADPEYVGHLVTNGYLVEAANAGVDAAPDPDADGDESGGVDSAPVDEPEVVDEQAPKKKSWLKRGKK